MSSRAPRRRRSLIPTRRTVLVALALLLAGGARIATAAPGDLQAHGSADRLWLARVEPAPGKNAGEVTTLFVREKNELAWRRLEPISARVLSLGSRGSQLAVLLPKGDWRLTTDTGFASGRPLPERARLVALGSGPGTLWAVGVAPTGGLSSTNPTTAPSSKPAATRPATATMAAAPTNPDDPGVLLLYRFAAQGWEVHGPLPSDIKQADAGSLSVADVGGVPLLAHKSGGQNVRVYRHAGGQRWDVVADVPSKSDVHDFKLLGGTSAPVLWVRTATGPPRLWFANPEGEPILRDLSVPDNADHAVAHANGAIRVIWLDAAGKVFDQRLNPATGAPEGDPATAAIPGPSIERAVLFWGQLILTTALLFALAASARRRREAQDLALDPDKLRLASFSTRLTAGVIDALPMLLAGWFILGRKDPEASELRILVTVLICAGAYILLTTIIELAVGRSVGKVLTGLQVVGLDGKPATAGARLMRNALRIIDLFAFPLALILFSPLRQRAGDLAAGTLVVHGKSEQQGLPVEDDQAQKDEGRQKDEG